MQPSDQDLIKGGWSEFPLEIRCYVLCIGLLYLLVFLVGIAGICYASWGKWDIVGTKIARFGVFMGLFLVASTFFDGVWYLLVWGRLYLSTDPFCEFVPFFPVTSGQVEAPFGENSGHLLGGANYIELFLVWALFAFATWWSTIYLSRSFFRVLGLNSVQEKPAVESADGA